MLRLWLGTRISRTALAIVPSLAALAAGCGAGNAAAGPGATVPHAPATTAASPDPYAIPTPITAAYVQRVLNALEAINAETATIVVRQRELSPDAARLLRSINTADEFGHQSQILLDDIDKGLSNYRAHPGPIRDAVNQLVSADSWCIFVAVDRDYSAVLTAVPKAHTSYLVLRRSQPQDDPTHINPTPWVVAFLGYNLDNSRPEDTCRTHQ